jgi:hypothetical protein
MVRTVCVPAKVGVTGFVEKLCALHAGGGEPAPVTLQANWTGKLYPLSAVNVTVELLELPGFTAAGVVAEIRNPCTVSLLIVE